jgi:hypothetical protein
VEVDVTEAQSMGSEEREQLRRAAELRRPIARAAAVGRGNGLGYVIFGALSAVLSLADFDLLGLAIAALLIATGMVELRAARRLAGADPAAPKILARGELVLMAGILVYCALQLTVRRASGEELASQLGNAGDLGVDLASLTDSLTTLIYATFIAVTFLYQGGMARYFLRRRAMIEAYLRESPEWARRVVGEITG